MSTLFDIEAATEALTLPQKEELVRFLVQRIRSSASLSSRARVVRQDNDTFLEAPAGAPPMTPEKVRQMLEDWP
jgi:hypothetical protein